jgi:hypothetical protein
MHLSRFRGIVKQLAAKGLTDVQRQFLDECFPEFRRLDQAAPALTRFGATRVIRGTEGFPTTEGRLRRFSGGRSLGSGRYWTVCHDESGQDGGALLKELMSYWQSSTGLLPNPRDSGYVEDHPDGTKSFRRYLHVVADRMETTFHCDFELNVALLELDRVVDLRFPDCQRWFFERFTALEEELGEAGSGSRGVQVATMKLRKLGDFVDLLPTLVTPQPGGAAFHQGIGAWLRAHGVDALIFPSARCDASVEISGDRLAFYGFNLVDYRNSGEVDWRQFFGSHAAWNREQHAQIRVERLGDAGWRIDGAEGREIARFKHEAAVLQSAKR